MNDTPNNVVNLAGKCVMVTGGARRLGRATALELARAGASVAITYHRSAEEAAQTVEELRAVAPSADAWFAALPADLTDTAQLHALLPAVLRDCPHPPVALVNNAAIFRRTPFDTMSEADFDDHIAANLKAPYLLCKAWGDEFLARGGGAILNIADIHGTRPLKNFVPYCVSKAGLIMLTETLALALAPTVRVNCLCPGTILPPSDDTSDDTAAAISLIRIPLERLGTPEEVAQAARFLLFGPQYLTGVVLPLDGGRRLR